MATRYHEWHTNLEALDRLWSFICAEIVDEVIFGIVFGVGDLANG